jgi:small-conductance mechanosensitive channel
MALNALELTAEIITIVVVILTSIILLFVVFGITDILANFFAGLVVRLRKSFHVGDNIVVRTDKKVIEGKLAGITLLHIRVDTGRSENLFIPNMLLFRSDIKIKKNDSLRKK